MVKLESFNQNPIFNCLSLLYLKQYELPVVIITHFYFLLQVYLFLHQRLMVFPLSRLVSIHRFQNMVSYCNFHHQVFNFIELVHQLVNHQDLNLNYPYLLTITSYRKDFIMQDLKFFNFKYLKCIHYFYCLVVIRFVDFSFYFLNLQNHLSIYLNPQQNQLIVCFNYFVKLVQL